MPELNSDGFYVTDGTTCQNCGRQRKVRSIQKGVWDYGVRHVRTLLLCKDCEDC